MKQPRKFVPVRLSEEDQLQRALVDHWRVRGVPGSVIAAIPNGGARSITTAKRLKITGTLAGMPDLVCIRAGQVFFIELKSKRGSRSKAQRAMALTMQAAGVEVHLIKDIDAGVALLELRGFLRLQSAVMRRAA